MGCDIHFFVETKQQDGSWQSADEWADDDGYKHVKEELYGDRNYSLFAILADVRNGRGFAGVQTGEGYNPIAAPRGLPDDVSKEVFECSEEWGIDGHSHSWFTLAELKAYDWDQVTKRCGIVDMVEFERYAKEGKPQSWCGGIGGPGIKIVSNEEMSLLMADKSLKERGFHYHTQVWWEETYRESVGTAFLTDTLTKMEALGNPENVRAVFWFDN